MNHLTYRERLEQIRDEKKKYDSWHVVNSSHKMTDKEFKKIKKWLADNITGNYIIKYQPGKMDLRYLFETEKDAIMFTLKWF
jgi:hypothetical protein